jgi:peptidylprolyl isomerase
VASKKKGNSQQARARKIAQARAAAEAQRRRQLRTRRMSIAGAVAVVAAVGVVAIVLISGGGSSKTDVSASSSTSSSAKAPESAAGKPCVPVADPLPAGAPAVPVKVGPPPTKLVTEDLKPGTGPVVTDSQSLTVNYIGVSCSTGKIFDSSYKTGKPASFPLSGVIPGWQKGIPGMKVGGQRLLGIPPEDGYGDSGSGGDIAPGETLWFVVEVLEAKAAPPPTAAPAPGP